MSFKFSRAACVILSNLQCHCSLRLLSSWTIKQAPLQWNRISCCFTPLFTAFMLHLPSIEIHRDAIKGPFQPKVLTKCTNKESSIDWLRAYLTKMLLPVLRQEELVGATHLCLSRTNETSMSKVEESRLEWPPCLYYLFLTCCFSRMGLTYILYQIYIHSYIFGQRYTMCHTTYLIFSSACRFAGVSSLEMKYDSVTETVWGILITLEQERRGVGGGESGTKWRFSTFQSISVSFNQFLLYKFKPLMSAVNKRS